MEKDVSVNKETEIRESNEIKWQAENLIKQQNKSEKTFLKTTSPKSIDDEEFQENKDYIKVPIVIEGGISQELVTENHKSLSTELICSICLELVRQPKLCKQCQHMFCSDCISKQLSKSKFCPNRCVFKQDEVNLIFKKILDKIEFKCLFHKEGCTSIQIYEKFDKHILSCIWGDFKCLSNNCDFKSNLKEIKVHVKNCPLKLVSCVFCSKEVSKKIYSIHYEECSNKEIQCEYCLVIVTNKEYDSHIDRCDEFNIRCDQCNKVFKRKNHESHSREVCLVSQVEYWKLRAETAESENKELKNKLKVSNNHFFDKLGFNNTSQPNNINAPIRSQVSNISGSGNSLISDIPNPFGQMLNAFGSSNLNNINNINNLNRMSSLNISNSNPINHFLNSINIGNGEVQNNNLAYNHLFNRLVGNSSGLNTSNNIPNQSINQIGKFLFKKRIAIMITQSM